MRRQLFILYVCLECLGFNPTTVEALLDESSYTNLTCSGATITDVGVDPSTLTSSGLTGPDNNLAFSYVCENFKYMFKCCGKIKEWKLYAGKTGTIQLQVWRRTDTRVYEMIGENYCQISTADTVTTCTINDYDKILVRYGDFVGWHNQGNETIKYIEQTQTDSSLENLFRRRNIGDLYPGDTYDWSEVDAYNDRLYAVQAIYEQSVNPTFTVSDMTVPDYLSNGDTIGRITYEDTDYMDNRSLTILPYATSTYYTTDLPSGYVSSNTAFRPRDDVLKYAMYDLCYKTATSSVSVTVQLTSLVIDNLDATFTLPETSSAQTLLHTITVTDPSDQWYCYSDWDTDLPFMLKASTTESYGVYVVEYPSFDYDNRNSYSTLPVVCVENKVTSTATVTGNIQVGLTKSRPPVITNLYASVTVNAETAFKGDSVFVVTATDPENEQITFTMSCTSDGSVDTTTFKMLKNGNVVLRRFVTLSTLHQFDCEVTVTDDRGDFSQNTLHIAIIEADHPVTIINMPTHPIELKENTAVGTYLYKFEYADRDLGTYDKKTWSYSVDDNNATRFFSIDPDTGVLSLAYSEIDAEEADIGVNKVYSLTITVGDLKSVTSGLLLIQITNENEAPWFTHDYFTIEATENSNGTQIESGTLFTGNFEDEDLKDAGNTYEKHFFSLDCDNVTNTHRFYLNIESGAIMFRGDYDLAVDGTPSQVECTITITDYYGLSDTARLYIHIENSNTYTPSFNLPLYTFYVAANAPVGTFLGKLGAIDYDSSDDYDNEITYYMNTTGQALMAINNDGSLYTVSSLETQTGNTLNRVVYASNYNINSGQATIQLIIPATTTVTTTTTDRNKDFYEDAWSYYWLFLSVFGCLLILVAIMFVLFRVCRLTRIGPYCYHCCMKGICCRPPPPGVRGFGDKGYDLATFGHRHTYADEDEEIDGWLHTKKEKKTQNNDKRYGTPNSGYDWSTEVRKEPVYEMFRIPSTSTVPKAATYLNPHTSTRNMPSSHSWKKI